MGCVRPELNLRELTAWANEEFNHVTSAACKNEVKSRSKIGKLLARLSLFGPIAINWDGQKNTEEILELLLFLAYPVVVEVSDIGRVPRMLDAGALAVSIRIFKSNSSRQTTWKSAFEQALLTWQQLSLQLPRERIQVEMDLSGATSLLDDSKAGPLMDGYYEMIKKIRQATRGILIRLPPQLSKVSFMQKLMAIHQYWASTEVPFCLIFGVDGKNKKELLQETFSKENTIIQGKFSACPDEQDENVIDCLWSCIESNIGEAMCPTVVVDGLGVALGLVHSSKQSLSKAVETLSGVYLSRTRGIWEKGKTSKNIQRLRKIDLDCDRDCLRFTVDQLCSTMKDGQFSMLGNFCHRNIRTDWGCVSGIQKLIGTLELRAREPVDGSYSCLLFQDQILLKNKLVEESLELAEAAETEDVASEASDLLYFMMVKCVQGNVGLEDIERTLDKKSLKITRRPGNAKSVRIAEAEEIISFHKSNGYH